MSQQRQHFHIILMCSALNRIRSYYRVFNCLAYNFFQSCADIYQWADAKIKLLLFHALNLEKWLIEWLEYWNTLRVKACCYGWPYSIKERKRSSNFCWLAKDKLCDGNYCSAGLMTDHFASSTFARGYTKVELASEQQVVLNISILILKFNSM